VLLAAAVLGGGVGTALGLRNASLAPAQVSDVAGRPTIVISTRATPAAPAASPPSASRSPVPDQEYVVQSGDTLRSIAQQLYGDAELWPRLYEQNRAVVGPDPNTLQPGMRLKIPAG
jgi:nucleoid-associated protein YgaU